MGRGLTAAGVLGALAFVLALSLAVADDASRFYVLVGAQLVGAIVAVVVVCIGFTALYLVGFEALGRRTGLLERRFSLFVGWNLLKSQRSVPTWGSRLVLTVRGLRGLGRSSGLKRLAVAASLSAAALALEHPAAFNAISERLGAVFLRTLQVAVLLPALPLLVAGTVAAVAPSRRRRFPPIRRRTRAAVTLPTFISIVGVSIGVWALTVVLSVMHGFESDLRDKILRTHAHVLIEPSPDHPGALVPPFALSDAVRALGGVVEANAFVEGEVMIASTTNVAVNVVVKGLDRATLEASEQLHGKVEAGAVRWLYEPEGLLSDRFRYPVDRLPMPDDDPLSVTMPPPGLGGARRQTVRPGLLIGSELAASLGVDVGTVVDVIAPDADIGPTGLRPKVKAFRVAGVFTTGMFEYDQKLAYMAIGEGQRFFNLGSRTNRLEVRVAGDGDRLDGVLTRLNGLLASAPAFEGLEATPWQVRHRSLFSALALERVVMFLVLGFIILVSSLLIVSSLVMLVVEKARDIALLKSLGASNRAISRTFLTIGAVIGGVGSTAGLSIGVATCAAIQSFGIALPSNYYVSELPVQMDPIEILVVGVSAFAVCLMATLYPAREASALEPVEGFRHG